jgi:hypothetical protein
MRVRSSSFALPKAGNTPDEYEDASWPRRTLTRETTSFRCAVADGATETSFSGLWAGMLVRAYCAGRLEGRRLPRTLSALRASWGEEVGRVPLPWYAEEKVRSGAYSSLLGLTVSALPDAPRWRAEAIGDSCLFHLRGGTLLAAFPLARAEDFNSRPYLLSSRAGGEDAMSRLEGTWESGDRFLLATDALAAWALAAEERGDHPWNRLLTVRRVEWADWLAELRAGGTMRNDDVTLLRVEVD